MLPRSDNDIRGHVKGLLVDGHSFPLDSVQDCLNLDFMKDYDQLRPAYDTLYDLTNSATNYAYLPTGYKILAAKQFRVTANNTTTEVAVVVAVDADNQNPKVLVNKWYNPSNAYGNYASGLGTGWLNNYIDVFETKDITAGATFAAEYGTIDTGDITKPDGYYKGWFVFSGDTCVGIVTNYVGSTGNIIVRRNIYVLNEATEGENNFGYRAITSGEDYTLCRFPCIGYGLLAGAVSITKAQIMEQGNGVKISFGASDIPPMLLTFLDKTDFFYKNDVKATSWGSGTNEYKYDWDGFWLSYDVPQITKKKQFIYKNQLSGSPIVAAIDHYYYFEQYTKELGIILKLAIRHKDYFSGGSYTYWSGALACSLDGYQGVFLKLYVLDNSLDETNDRSNVEFEEIRVIHKVDFDRRLSHYHFFLGQDTTRPQILSTFDQEWLTLMPQMTPDRGGHVDIQKKWGQKYSNVNIGDENAYEVLVIDEEVNPRADTPSLSSQNFLSLYDDANGLLLNSYLNQYYWGDIRAKSDVVFRVGETVIAAGLKNYTPDNKDETLKNGHLKYILSSLQNGNIQTHSVFPYERIRQIDLHDKFISGMGTISDNFLIWTDTTLFSLRIADYSLGLVQEQMVFNDRGAISHKAVVKAQVNYNYAGAYWMCPSGSIYRILDDYPEDILYGRWRDYYQESISTNDKNNAVSGYLPRTKEVFFQIGTKIYVWNLEMEHWKIYSYPDAATVFDQTIDSELMFASGRKIYKTEGLASVKHKDKTTDTINFNLAHTVTYNDETMLKILDRVDLIFEKTIVDARVPSYLNIRAGVNSKVTADIIDKNVEINQIEKHTETMRVRKPGNYFGFKLSGNSANLQKFRLLQMKIVSALTKRQLTEI